MMIVFWCFAAAGYVCLMFIAMTVAEIWMGKKIAEAKRRDDAAYDRNRAKIRGRK